MAYMIKDEKQIEKMLGISTIDPEESYEDYLHSRYEPTPYVVLQRLKESGYLDGVKHLADYGCGKGRVAFWLSHEMGMKVTGIDHVPEYIEMALMNKGNRYPGVEFVCGDAEKWILPEDVDACYFFNPFELKLFRKVLHNIISSSYEHQKEITLILYYPDEAVLGYLMSVDEVEFVDEIRCDDLFEEKSQRECLMIFRIQ